MNSPEMAALIAAAIKSMEGANLDGNSPYEVTLAEGGSGISFGEYQNDVLNGTQKTKDAFEAILKLKDENGKPYVDPQVVADIYARATNKNMEQKYSAAELKAIDAAMSSPQGMLIVNEADAATIDYLPGEVQKVVDAAYLNPNGPGDFNPSSSNFAETITVVAAWINRTGKPTAILDFVQGNTADIHIDTKLPEDSKPTLEMLYDLYLKNTKQHSTQTSPEGVVGIGESLIKWQGRIHDATPLGEAAAVGVAKETFEDLVNKLGCDPAPKDIAFYMTGTTDAVTVHQSSALSADGFIPDPSASVQNILIAGVPDGAILSAGTDNGNGTWLVQAADLAGLDIAAPIGVATDFSLMGYALETLGGVVNVDPAAATQSFAITMNTALADTTLETMLAGRDVIISGVPLEARLNVGTANDDGTWSVSAADVSRLAVSTPHDFSASFNLTAAVPEGESGGGCDDARHIL
jgi:hypothetical protein